jgi:glutathione S-transferase
MLEHKGIEHRVEQITPGFQPLVLRARGFKAATVPALRVDGRRIQGTREISRALDEICPDPPLFPADPGLRAAVEEAESWGESAYQPVPRHCYRWALTRDPALRVHMASEAKLPAPALAGHLTLPMAAYFARAGGASEAAVRSDLASLPTHLERIDELIAAGTIGAEALNAADFQIATTTRVLLNFPQIRPLIESRPAAGHAMRICPKFGREVPLRLPPEWIPA